MRRALLTASCLLASGCSCGTDPAPRVDAAAAIDGRVLDAADRDAASDPDAGDECVMSKFRTSGLASPFGQGAQCDFFVICSDRAITGDLRDQILAAFPTADCTATLDYTCREGDVASCIVHVADLDATEVDAGCALSRRADVVGLVCAGDL